MSDKTNEDEAPEYETLIMDNDGSGTIPTPEHVQKDEKAQEICRVWLHSDGSISNITSPYLLEGPQEWGSVLAGIARSLAHNMPAGEWSDEEILSEIVQGFLGTLGLPVKFLIVRSGAPEPPVDPSKVN